MISWIETQEVSLIDLMHVKMKEIEQKNVRRSNVISLENVKKTVEQWMQQQELGSRLR
jgi:hypothetical protein